MPTARRPAFSRRERARLAGLYSVIAALHVLGWGLFLHYSAHHPALAGLGFAAYLFGLRHAFDADHIAAVDDTVRYLVHQGRRPLGVGFFFSLGHSTIVLALAAGIALAAAPIKHALPGLQDLGGVIGGGVSGLFLWVIGLLNLLVLLDIVSLWRDGTCGEPSHARLEETLARRGLMNRLFGARARTIISRSWHMYPLGLLFGLGFDTASEIALLVMTAGASAGDLPAPAVLSLPILFAAGMSVMDTTDGVLMVRAYDWALFNPLRKVFYNITTTGLTVAVALTVGTLELLRALGALLGLHGPVFRFIGGLDLGALGYLIVGLFLAMWAASFVLWEFGAAGAGAAGGKKAG